MAATAPKIVNPNDLIAFLKTNVKSEVATKTQAISTEYEKKITTLNSTISSKDTAISQKDAKITELTNSNNTKDSTITSLNSQIKTKDSTISSLNTQVSNLTNEKKQLTTDKTNLSAQVTQLTKDKTSLQTQVTNLTNDKNTLTTQKNNLQTQVNTLTSDKTSLQSQVNTLQTFSKIIAFVSAGGYGQSMWGKWGSKLYQIKVGETAEISWYNNRSGTTYAYTNSDRSDLLTAFIKEGTNQSRLYYKDYGINQDTGGLQLLFEGWESGYYKLRLKGLKIGLYIVTAPLSFEWEKWSNSFSLILVTS